MVGFEVAIDSIQFYVFANFNLTELARHDPLIINI